MSCFRAFLNGRNRLFSQAVWPDHGLLYVADLGLVLTLWLNANRIGPNNPPSRSPNRISPRVSATASRNREDHCASRLAFQSDDRNQFFPLSVWLYIQVSEEAWTLLSRKLVLRKSDKYNPGKPGFHPIPDLRDDATCPFFSIDDARSNEIQNFHQFLASNSGFLSSLYRASQHVA